MTFFYRVCFSLWVCCTTLLAHADDRVLFTVGNTPVYVSEFEYIYNKNNFNDKADYSLASLQEYLDLYTRFRLKIKEAEELGRDTLHGIRSEIAMYRQQLFDSYIDRNFAQKMVQETYERMKYDISISQIYFRVGPNTDPELIKLRADSVYQRLKGGASFEEMARQYSDDQYSREEGGFLGFYTALQINHKSLEDAVYGTPEGKISAPVKTSLGYHIIKVNKVRPSAGRVKVAIIKKMIPEEEGEKAAVAMLMDSLHRAILAGADFGALASQHSDDFMSGMRGGELEWFGINTYNYIFEDAAFSLQTPGEVSPPVRTGNAWYIIRLINKTGLGPFEDVQPALHARLTNHPQYEEVMRQLTDSLKLKYAFERYEDIYAVMLKNLEGALDSFATRFEDAQPTRPALKIGNLLVSNNELGNLMLRNNFKVKRTADRQQWLRSLYNKAERDLVFQYHRDQLLESEPELYYLMREYRDGILLFDITEIEVWNKAMADTAGLAAFYENNKERFAFDDRLQGIQYTLTEEKDAKSLRKLLDKSTTAPGREELNGKGIPVLSAMPVVLEKNKPLPSGVKWAKGPHGPIKGSSIFTVFMITDILPARMRTLDEARGFVIAAYQEELEEKWVDRLRAKYPVVINGSVFNSLVK